MAERGVSRCNDEQEGLGRSAKTQQKYGTATRTPCSATTPDLFVKHFVQKDETLPGIALKYGRSVCQFCRRLVWASLVISLVKLTQFDQGRVSHCIFPRECRFYGSGVLAKV